MSGYDPELPFSKTVDPSVERLPVSVINAYGAVNDWIARDRARFASTIQADHLLASQDEIRQTTLVALQNAAQGEERTALILGSGTCQDIPLQEIVEGFDKTTLVDVDAKHTERALSELPRGLLGKVSLVQADVSGAVGKFVDAYSRASEETEYSRFVSQAAGLVRAIDVVGSQADLGGNYNFVSSHLLTSQFMSIPVIHNLQPLVERIYQRPFVFSPNGEERNLAVAINEQGVRMQVGHIRQLGRLVGTNGTVHYADTVLEQVGN